MQVKNLQPPTLPQRERKTVKGWVVVFAQPNVNYYEDDEPEDKEQPFDTYTHCFDHKPTQDDLDEIAGADPDWELISLMEIAG